MIKRTLTALLVILTLLLGVTAISVAAANTEEKPVLNIGVVTNSPSKDLAKVLQDNYDGVKVYSSIDSALSLAKADGIDGLMILADNYPGVTTALTAVQAAKLGSLGIRTYIEYPANNSSLGITGFEGTDVMGYQRAVVTDAEALGMAEHSILYVHGARYLKKTDISRSWLVNARVAGYDIADYGLTDCTPYSMLETNEAGNVLIASTKLSQFVSARYAPYERWQTLWESVLSWVSGSTVDSFDWEPLVSANYSPEDVLGEDAYEEAVRLNTEWYMNANMLPAADGSQGIWEGYSSGSSFNEYGDQYRRLLMRADCNGESIGAIALAGTLLGEEEYKDVAYNAMRWLLTESELANGDRADVNKSQYGLLSWHDQAMNQYYGDDNAKAILGLILGAAALGTDEFDERILEAIIANFRTAGIYGYRGGRLLAEDIERSGWEYFYNSTTTNYSSHFEALLWACYLWAYEQTGYEPLLDRSRTAISMMMTAYENTMVGDLDGGVNEWHSTNGLQQDRAKMILPLAWLVRVEPTEEHIAWLDLMISDMMALQDEATGALREEFAEDGYGIIDLPPFSKNSDYGTAEAPVIQKNGDPCSDSLYTSSFAMMALNEAYAAMAAIGNSTLAEKFGNYATSLSDYHVRIQQVSTKAQYNGAWFRAFDYEKWETYGSDGDAGWGVWCIETGWSQSWISATLSLEAMGTNIWDYTKTTTVADKFNDVAIRMLNFDESKLFPISTLETSKEVSVRGTSSVLFDGIFGSTTYSDGKWVGAEGVDITLTVDYQRRVEFDIIQLHFLHNMGMGICPPSAVEFYGSADGKSYELLGTVRLTEDIQAEYAEYTKNPSTFFEYATLELERTANLRYLKIEVRTAGTYVHPYHGTIPHWIFMDELEVMRKQADLTALSELVATASGIDTDKYQPATVLVFDKAYSDAVAFINSVSPNPDFMQGLYDALVAAIDGLRGRLPISIYSLPDGYTKYGDASRIINGNHAEVAGSVQLVKNAYTTPVNTTAEFILDLGDVIDVLTVGYSAESRPASGIYSQNAEIFVSDSPDGPWVSIGALKGRMHLGEYQDVSEYHTVSTATSASGRYIKYIFSSAGENEIAFTKGQTYTPDGKLRVAEWFFPTELFVNEFRRIDVSAEDATVSITDEGGNPLPSIGAMLGQDVKVSVDSTLPVTGAVINGTPVEVVGNALVIPSVLEKQTVIINFFTFSEEELPVFVGVKEWFVGVGEEFDPLADIYAYDSDCTDISDAIRVIGGTVGTAVGKYQITYQVKDAKGASSQVTTTVHVVPATGGNRVIAITPSTKMELVDYAYKLFDGVFAPESANWSHAAFVRWCGTSPIEILVRLDGITGIADIGLSLASCPWYGFLPPDVEIYVADTLDDEWVQVADFQAQMHGAAMEKYDFLRLSVPLDNVTADYAKIIISFDYDNSYDNVQSSTGQVGSFKPEWTIIDEITVNPYYTARVEESEGGRASISVPHAGGALYGEDITVTLIPSSGYVIDGLLVNGERVALMGNRYIIKGVTRHAVIEGIFVPETVGGDRISGVALDLADGVSMVFYARSEAALESLRMTFTVNGKKVTVNPIATEEEGVYAFYTPRIAPQFMGDAVSAVLSIDGVDVQERFYSIESYCRDILSDIDTGALTLPDGERAALVRVICNLLDLGAAAQKKEDYNAGYLVNEGITGSDEFTPVDATHAAEITAATDVSVYYIGGGIHCGNAPIIYLRLAIGNSALSSVEIRVGCPDGRSVTYAASELAMDSTGCYLVYLPAPYAVDYEARFTVEMMAGGRVVQRATLSICSYVCLLQNQTAGGSLTADAELVRALYKYGESVKALAALTDGE